MCIQKFHLTKFNKSIGLQAGLFPIIGLGGFVAFCFNATCLFFGIKLANPAVVQVKSRSSFIGLTNQLET